MKRSSPAPFVSALFLVLAASVCVDTSAFAAPRAPGIQGASRATRAGLWLREALRPAATDRAMVYVELEAEPAVALLARPSEMADPAMTDRVREHVMRQKREHQALHREIEQLGGDPVADLVRLANAIQARIPVRSLDRVRSLPGVKGIYRVPSYQRSTASASSLIGAPTLWGVQGTGLTGKGVRVAVIDTGIDYTHADFGGPGTIEAYASNDRSVSEPGTFPTPKVVGGWDFVGDAYTGQNNPQPDEDPLDCATVQGTKISGGHGTHVAGIVAGTGVLKDGTSYAGGYEASFDATQFRIGPGMAPEASLYALKIFGCEGETSMVAPALEWAADPNDDGDMSDRLDVVNMSLGTSYGIATPVDRKQVENLTKLGTLVVVAAGNDGDVFFAAGAPSTYTEAVSIAATTDSISFLGMQVLTPSSIQGDVPCAEGFFTKPLAQSGAVTGQLVATVPADACASLTNAAQLQGKIALINRGKCTFVSKIQKAEQAGAIAAVMVDNADADVPFAMGGDGSSAGIPGVMITKAEGAKILAKLGQGVTVLLDPAHEYSIGIGADHMASFSSRGPRATDWLLKPDVAAPGSSIDSAGVASGAGAAQMSGTSMACPVAAGGAALLRSGAPSLGPLEIKASMMNGADLLEDAEGNPTPVSLGGAGRLALSRSAGLQMSAAAKDPAGAISLSFGSVVADEPASSSRALVITNRGASARQVELTVQPSYELTGVEVKPETTSLQVAAGDSATVGIELRVDPSMLPPAAPDAHTPAVQWDYTRHFLVEAAGHVMVRDTNDSSQTLRVPYHASVRAGAKRHASTVSRCAGAEDGSIAIPVAGHSSHPEPRTSAFELLATSDAFETTDPSADLIALGAATNLGTKEPFAEASIYFAVAVDGTWTTPARGPLSLVGVAIDVTGDDEPEFAVQAEPLTRTGPYLDVLAATLYDLQSGSPVGSPRFLNILSRDRGDTQPFANSVIVFPVTIGSLGIEPGATEIGAFAYAQSGSLMSMDDVTDMVRWDPGKRIIDTASLAESGIPYHGAADPVRVQVDWAAKGTSPLPRMLLMHHTNVPGERIDVVDLEQAGVVQPADLRVTATAQEAQDGATEVTVSVTVTNDADVAAREVTLSWTPKNGSKPVQMTSSKGSCSLSGVASCKLGELAPKAQVSAELVFAIGAGGVSGTVQATTEDGCDLKSTNNVAAVSVGVSSEPDAGVDAGGVAAVDDAYAGGSACACRASGRSANGAWGAMLGVAVAMGMAGYRRRRRNVSGRDRREVRDEG